MMKEEYREVNRLRTELDEANRQVALMLRSPRRSDAPASAKQDEQPGSSSVSSRRGGMPSVPPGYVGLLSVQRCWGEIEDARRAEVPSRPSVTGKVVHRNPRMEVPKLSAIREES